MTFTTKALQKVSAEAPFEIVDLPRRSPRADDVVIHIHAAGICHSDIHTIRNEWGPAHFPLTVGHEIAGVVTEVGADVTEFKVGDRVGVGCLVNSCQECEYCQQGEEQNCQRGSVGTYNSEDVDGSITQGGYAQHVVVNKNFVCTIPDAIPFEQAAPLLCAGITSYSPLARWNVGPGDKVAVLGLGGLGHMGVQIAKAKGADVTVLSRSTAKEEAALALGADRLLATSDEDFFKEHKASFDFILNTVSAPIELSSYLRLLKPRGVLAVVGLPPEKLPVGMGSLINGGKVLTGSNIGGIKETQEMLDFCAEHSIAAVVEVVSAQEVDAVYDRVVQGEVTFRAVIDTATLSA